MSILQDRTISPPEQEKAVLYCAWYITGIHQDVSWHSSTSFQGLQGKKAAALLMKIWSCSSRKTHETHPHLSWRCIQENHSDIVFQVNWQQPFWQTLHLPCCWDYVSAATSVAWSKGVLLLQVLHSSLQGHCAIVSGTYQTVSEDPSTGLNKRTTEFQWRICLQIFQLILNNNQSFMLQQICLHNKLMVILD